MLWGKKFINKPRILIRKENLKSKPNKFRLEKRGLFFGSQNSGTVQNA